MTNMRFISLCVITHPGFNMSQEWWTADCELGEVLHEADTSIVERQRGLGWQFIAGPLSVDVKVRMNEDTKIEISVVSPREITKVQALELASQQPCWNALQEWVKKHASDAVSQLVG